MVDHHTYVICSDGDLMEGVAAEAASLAGHLRLGKLIALYDSNNISLDGETAHSFTEDVRKRFEAYGWQVLRVENGNDLEAIDRAIEEAKADTGRPTLIEVRTTIGYGSPRYAGTSTVHGKPLGQEEVAEVRKAYGWPSEEPFFVPEEVRKHFAAWKEEAAKREEEAGSAFYDGIGQTHPSLARQLQQAIAGQSAGGVGCRSACLFAGRQTAGHPPGFRCGYQRLGQKACPPSSAVPPTLASSNNTTMKEEGIFHAEDYTGGMSGSACGNTPWARP